MRQRITKNRILRFRHDLNYALMVRMSISLIMAILPIGYRIFSRDIKVIQFDILFVISSLILTFTTCFLFFSFIHHQIFFTDKMDLFSFILQDITTIIKWPEGVDSDDEDKKEKKSNDDDKKDGKKKKKFGFNEARMDRFKLTSETADMTDDLLSEMDLASLPYCNVLEHGNALAWVEMRRFESILLNLFSQKLLIICSWIQGMIKGLLSKVDMLLVVICILLFVDASFIIYLAANHNEYGNQQMVINGIVFGGIALLYLCAFNLYPLLMHGPKLRKLQKQQLSGLEKQKLMATNIVNNDAYFSQFRFRDDSGLWDGKLKKFAPE